MKKHRFNIWPEAKEEDFNELVEDIRQNGFDQGMPITIYQGEILDGWNRWRACQVLGINPPTVEFSQDDTAALAFTLRTNKRRNLSSGQKAALAVEADGIMELLKKEAEDRVGGRPKKDEGKPGQVFAPVSKDENKTATKAAEIFGTNRTYVNQAAKLRSEAPEVFDKLKAGKTTMQEARKEAARKPTTEEWLPDELERKAQVESGKTVIANLSRDKHLIQWADRNGLSVLVDRGTKFGNPFVLNDDGDRDTVCDSYRDHYLPNKPSILRALPALKGKVLICHCYPERCHAQSLIS